jgi:hypothetical protein
MAVSNPCERFFVEHFSACNQNGGLPKLYILKNFLAHKVWLLYNYEKNNTRAIFELEIFKLLSTWLRWTDAQKEEFLANLSDDSHNLVKVYTYIYYKSWDTDVQHPLRDAMPPSIDQQKLRLEFQIDEARFKWISAKIEA